jgi:hypothetical protein
MGRRKSRGEPARQSLAVPRGNRLIFGIFAILVAAGVILAALVYMKAYFTFDTSDAARFNRFRWRPVVDSAALVVTGSVIGAWTYSRVRRSLVVVTTLAMSAVVVVAGFVSFENRTHPIPFFRSAFGDLTLPEARSQTFSTGQFGLTGTIPNATQTWLVERDPAVACPALARAVGVWAGHAVTEYRAASTGDVRYRCYFVVTYRGHPVVFRYDGGGGASWDLAATIEPWTWP